MEAFTHNQATDFFTKIPWLSLQNNISDRLLLEGLINVDNYDDFKEDQLKKSVKNIHIDITVIPAVSDYGSAADITAVSPIPPVLVSAKCDLRLKVLSIANHYYVSIGRTVTPSNINYTNVLKGFNVEYKALITIFKDINTNVPLLSKNQTLLKWIESLKDCFFCAYSLCLFPLIYVVREDNDVSNEAGDLFAAIYL